jgi:ribosomal protein L37AE/L43A
MNQKKKYILLENGGELELAYLIEKSNELRQYQWLLETWKPRPALIDKNGGSTREYTGQKFDPRYLEIVEKGWTHDHCEICFTMITDGDEAFESDGIWICDGCFHKFVKPEDLGISLKQLKQIEK